MSLLCHHRMVYCKCSEKLGQKNVHPLRVFVDVFFMSLLGLLFSSLSFRFFSTAFFALQ